MTTCNYLLKYYQKVTDKQTNEQTFLFYLFSFKTQLIILNITFIERYN